MINLQYVVCKKFKIENNEIGIKDNVFIINLDYYDKYKFMYFFI